MTEPTPIGDQPAFPAQIKEIYSGRYGVSKDGRVFSFWFINRYVCRRRTIPLELNATLRSGYPKVSLSINGKIADVYVHRLVLESFVGICPDGCEAGHRDGNRENNNLDNLAWITPRENQMDRFRHGTDGLGERNASAKLSTDQVREIHSLRGKISQARIASMYEVCRDTIRKIWIGQRWPHVLAELSKPKP